MELLSGPRDAARMHDRAEDLKISEVHCVPSISCPFDQSQIEIINIIIIHFT
jgi:hypothetical protein